jgi:transposase InsO family protein
MIRTSASEKMEIIRLVEESGLPVRRVLAELDIAPTTFYRWYEHYQAEGEDGLVDRRPSMRQYWNRIPDTVRAQVVALALANPEMSPRDLAWHFVDTQQYFISEPGVYRILKRFDLITSPAFTVITSAKQFKHPTKRINELWQTDFTQFKVVGWGWYYLSTVIDDYSRYILAAVYSRTEARHRNGKHRCARNPGSGIGLHRRRACSSASPASPVVGQRPSLLVR